MSKTKIQWTEYNWNPFTGCTPASPGCANCYARRNARRLAGNPKTDRYSKGFEFSIHPECLDEPLRWKKPRKVFVNTMSDTFHEDAPIEAIQQIFDRMVKCPQHIFQVLTKRAERMAELSVKLPWPSNVWAGVTVENADYLHRLDFLRQVPAAVRFVSFEPLLGAIPNINLDGIQWVIVGGESGPKARPMDLDWARDILSQCLAAKIPFFFKQVGGTGRDKGGHLLDGKEWNEFPVAQTSVESPKAGKPPEIMKGTVEKADAQFPWMVKGTVSPKSDGTCNVLVVAPHGHPKNDINTEKLGAHLAATLDSYAVINNQRYRKPNPRKKEQPNLAAGIMDLNVPAQAQQCKDDYWAPILDSAKEINKTRNCRAILLFIHGMDDKAADARPSKPDIAVGKGFIGTYDPKAASGKEKFFDDLIQSMNRQQMGVVRDDVDGYSGRGKLPPYLYLNSLKLGIDIEAVQLEFRFRGYRDVSGLMRTAEKLARAIEGISLFKSWRTEEMAKAEVVRTKVVDRKPGDQVMPEQQSAMKTGEKENKRSPAAAEQPVQPVAEVVASPSPAADTFGMVDRAEFEAAIKALRERKTIQDDKGDEIAFTDALKESFVQDIESAYPVIMNAARNLWETGKFLHDVRERQKKNRLWTAFQDTVGLRKSATNNYIRVYERFGDRLAEYGRLGVSKLQDVARLKDPFGFLEAHKEEVEKGDVRSVTKLVQAEADAKRAKKGKRQPQHVEVGSFRIKLASNGRILTIQNLNKDMQNKLVEHLKEFLSQAK